MPMIDLEPAAREVRRLLGGVADEQLADPTPCAGTSVAGLLDHLMGLTLAFTWAAQKQTVAGERGRAQARADKLDPAWRTVLPQRLEQLVDAWRVPSAWDGVTAAGGATLPAAVTGVVALDELVLHGWDLARATGQPFRCDPISTEAVLEFTRQTTLPANEAMRAGIFGPVVAVPDTALALDRALGYAGRDPDWTPDAVSGAV